MTTLARLRPGGMCGISRANGVTGVWNRLETRIALSSVSAASGLKNEADHEVRFKSGKRYKLGYQNITGTRINSGIENKTGKRYKAGNNNV